MPTTRHNSGPMITGGVARALRKTLSETPLDGDALFAKVGLTDQMLQKPLGYIPLEAVCELFEEAALLLQDECFGLRMAKHVDPGFTGLLGHLALTSPTARDALSLMAGYCSVFVTDFEVGYEEYYESGLAIGYWKYPESISARLQLNCFTAGSVIFRLRDAMGDDWTPLKIELDHRKPNGCYKCDNTGCPDCEELIRSVLGPNVEFDKPMNRLIHPISGLNKPMRRCDPQINELHLDHARRAMENQAYRFAMSERVKSEIIANIKQHEASLNVIAEQIGISPRALQSHLHSEGTTFEELLTDIRRHMAERLLRETDKPLSDIAFDLGYADPSVFSRAVRRWFNETPREFRLRHRRSERTH